MVAQLAGIHNVLHGAIEFKLIFVRLNQLVEDSIVLGVDIKEHFPLLKLWNVVLQRVLRPLDPVVAAASSLGLVGRLGSALFSLRLRSARVAAVAW